jgi:hypothetical protein
MEKIDVHLDWVWTKDGISYDDYFIKEGLHHCHNKSLYSEAIDECYEDLDGLLIAQNSEYESQINYCPFCGYKAKIQTLE